jgi:nucleotidyltransferase substrate binding protein (TIGR01987 family)
MSEVDLALEKFKTALTRLEEGVKKIQSMPQDDLGKDGVIQRFEFTFELLWKALKIFLESKGVLCKAPIDCLQEAFRLGLIRDDVAFGDMLKDRNKTSPIYSKDQAEEILHHITVAHLPKMKELLARLTGEFVGHKP